MEDRSWTLQVVKTTGGETLDLAYLFQSPLQLGTMAGTVVFFQGCGSCGGLLIDSRGSFSSALLLFMHRMATKPGVKWAEWKCSLFCLNYLLVFYGLNRGSVWSQNRRQLAALTGRAGIIWQPLMVTGLQAHKRILKHYQNAPSSLIHLMGNDSTSRPLQSYKGNDDYCNIISRKAEMYLRPQRKPLANNLLWRFLHFRDGGRTRWKKEETPVNYRHVLPSCKSCSVPVVSIMSQYIQAQDSLFVWLQKIR